MKLIALLLISMFQTSFQTEHDVVIAIFSLSQDDQSVKLEIGFDIEDYLFTNKILKEQVTIAQVSQYLNDKTSWIINDTNSTIAVVSLYVDEEHFRAECALNISNIKIEKVKIFNEFFMNVDGHSNIIRLDINGKRKDYRMYEGRKMIEVLF